MVHIDNIRRFFNDHPEYVGRAEEIIARAAEVSAPYHGMLFGTDAGIIMGDLEDPLMDDVEKISEHATLFRGREAQAKKEDPGFPQRMLRASRRVGITATGMVFWFGGGFGADSIQPTDFVESRSLLKPPKDQE
ncbi:hypothetical protein KJ903_04840 [Patescibacteria group bacterium]|nr:hypothetical protein [Patescibacteria group bacterium]